MRRVHAACILPALLGLVAALLPVHPATAAAPATSVVLTKVPSGTASVGATLTVAGKVRGGVKGQKVSLQRRTPSGWRSEATKGIARTLKFRFSWTAVEGSRTYRVAAAKSRRARASTSKNFKVRGIASSAPSFDVDELPDGYQGVMYRFDGFGARSGWDYSVVAGALPGGIVLTEAPDEGYLDGTPTTPGTYDFTLRITAPGAAAAERDFTIVVHPTGSWDVADDRVAAVSNDGTRAVSGATAYGIGDQGPAYLDLVAGTASPIPLPEVPDDGSPDSVSLAPLDLSGDGRYVLLQYHAQYYPDLNWYWLFRWDSVTGEYVQLAEAQYQNPYEATLSGDGSVAAWSVDAAFEVWEESSGVSTPVENLPGGHGWYPVALSLSDDGRYLLYSHYPGLWLLDRQLHTHTEIDGSASAPAALSRNGTTVVYNDIAQTSPFQYVLRTWDRTSGSTTVVSRLADGAPVKNDDEYPATISGDGQRVFLSSDRGLGADRPEDAAADFHEPFLWDATTARIVPLPMIPGTSGYPNLPDAREITWTEPSFDGSVAGASLWEKYGNVGYALFSLAPSWFD